MLLQLLSGKRVLTVGTDTQEAAAVHFMQGQVGLCNFSVSAKEREGSVFTVCSIHLNSSQTGCVYILIQILLLVSRSRCFNFFLLQSYILCAAIHLEKKKKTQRKKNPLFHGFIFFCHNSRRAVKTSMPVVRDTKFKWSLMDTSRF